MTTGKDNLPSRAVSHLQSQSVASTLSPIKEVEVDGIQMGVLSDGTPYLTARGISRLCGIRPATLLELGNGWAEEKSKPRGLKIQEFLTAHGYDGDVLFLRIQNRGSENHAYPDSVCMALLEYYAFESTHGNDTALRSYRILARHSLRTFIYNRCGYDPSNQIPEAWRNFHERMVLNNGIPVDYFSVFREIADMVIHLIQVGCPIDDHTIPDISVGVTWGRFWSENDLQAKHGERKQHPHNYPDWFPQAKANPLSAWIYPIGALGDFRTWLYRNYISVHFPKYVDGKVKANAFPLSRGEIMKAALTQRLDGNDSAAQALPGPNG